MIVLAIQLTVL